MRNRQPQSSFNATEARALLPVLTCDRTLNTSDPKNFSLGFRVIRYHVMCLSTKDAVTIIIPLHPRTGTIIFPKYVKLRQPDRFLWHFQSTRELQVAGTSSGAVGIDYFRQPPPVRIFTKDMIFKLC